MLHSLPREIQRELRPKMRQAGELVAAKARSNASEWSERIPGAISVRTSFGTRTAGAAVVVNSAAAPHARPYEGLSARGGTFRVPVFGRWLPDVESRATRPFLFPAGVACEAAAAHLVEQAVDSAIRRAG